MGIYSTNFKTVPVTVGSSSTAVIAANPNRTYLLLENDSDTIIYLQFGGNPAVANTGIRLNANGGNWESSAAAGNLFSGAVSAISASSNKNLLVVEGTQ